MLPNITIEGRAVADPELRFTTGGKGVCNLRIAANDAKKLDDGTWENTEQVFISCSVWNTDKAPAIAEHIAEQVHKGDKLIVTGRLYQREYESNGEKRTSLEMKFPVVAKVIEPARGGSSGSRRPAQTPPLSDPWGSSAPAGDEPPF